MNGKISRIKLFKNVWIDVEGAALRVLSYLNDDTNQHNLASLANEKRKVTIIGEEHEPDELVWNFIWFCSVSFFFSINWFQQEEEEEEPASAIIDAEEASLTPEQLKVNNKKKTIERDIFLITKKILF
jgi:hypothetical protein